MRSSSLLDPKRPRIFLTMGGGPAPFPEGLIRKSPAANGCRSGAFN